MPDVYPIDNVYPLGFCRAQARKNPRSDRSLSAHRRIFLDFLFLLSPVEECIKAKERTKAPQVRPGIRLRLT